MVFTCCVRGCTYNNKQQRMHVFPLRIELFREWCVLINREDLLTKDVRSVRKSYRVCDVHFDEESRFLSYKNRTNIKYGAEIKPSLYLPGASSSQERREGGATAMPDDLSVPGPSGVQVLKGVEALQHTTGTQPVEVEIDENIPAPAESQQVKTKKTTPSERLRVLQGRSKKLNLLHKMQLFKKEQLTPKKRKLYSLAKEYVNVARRLDAENSSNAERLRTLLDMTKTGAIWEGKVNRTTRDFLRCQLSQQAKKPKGRRFTLEDKMLGLLLLKQSPKGYKLLQRLFALPSRKTLMALLRKVPFACGINPAILQSMQRSIGSLNARDKHCVLVFDEMSLQPSLFYNAGEDRIDGLADDGEQQTNRIADHAMVFMLKGVSKKWKQPIAYFFNENAMKSADIAKFVKEAIRSVQAIGLTVVATICDQFNKPALNMLVEESRSALAREGQTHEPYSFFVEGQEIIPLFDTPHLLKGLRNNMLNADVHFQWRGSQTQVAKWEHVIKLYELDGTMGTDIDPNDINVTDYRMLNRLTDAHIYPHVLKKMKVKNAAQVFSQRVSSVMRKFARHSTELPSEAEQTANFLLFVDRLFDSVNGSVITPTEGKLLRCAVTPTSPHCAFWLEAIQVLRSVKYVKNGREYVPPTVTNWIVTLSGLLHLWRTLQAAGFEFLLPRHLNQDALENFFGCIRGHAGRHVNPTCTSFRSSFKSLIINNFMSPHSPGSNCEEDDSDGALDSLKTFLQSRPDDDIQGIFDPTTTSTPHIPFSFKCLTNTHVIETEAYLTGYLARSIFKEIGICKVCRSTLIAPDDSPHEEDLIYFRSYAPKALLRARTKFCALFNLCYQVAHFYIVRVINQSNIQARLLALLHQNIHFVNLSHCAKHDLFALFLRKFIRFYLFTYVSNVNKILNGHYLRNINDSIKAQALQRFKKYKKQQLAVRQTKQLQL